MARRYALRDDQWARIKDFLPGREGHVGGTAGDNRLFVDAVLYRYRAGVPWRDLPERFGHWKNWLIIPGMTPDTLGEIYEYYPTLTELRVAAAIFAIGFLVFTLMLKVAVPISLGEFMGEKKRETVEAAA